MGQPVPFHSSSGSARRPDLRIRHVNLGEKTNAELSQITSRTAASRSHHESKPEGSRASWAGWGAGSPSLGETGKRMVRGSSGAVGGHPEGLGEPYLDTFKFNLGTSLMVPWLRLHTPNAGGTGSIPGRGTKILHAAQHGLKN